MKKLGAHVPSAHGLRYAVITARALETDVFQTMLADGTTWSPPKISAEAGNEFKKLAFGMGVYVHLPYTINPCLARDHPRYKAQKAVTRKYLEACDELGAHAVVIHPGFKKELSELAAKKGCTDFFQDVQGDADVRILLETDSGSKNGSAIGSPGFIKDVLDDLGRARFGMVLDTEHLFGRGYDLWDEATRAEILTEYRGYTELIHLNAPDPGVELGSFRDRHSIPFEEYERDSADLIRDCLATANCILERASLGVSERDIAFIRTLLHRQAEVLKGRTDQKASNDFFADPSRTIQVTDI